MIDLLRIPDHACDRAEAAGDPHRARVGERGEPPVEHPGVELVGFAVHVHVAAGKVYAHQRMAAQYDARNQLIDEGILRTAQRCEIELGGRQKRAGIDAPAMGRIEHDRSATIQRLEYLEGRVDVCLHRVVHCVVRAFLEPCRTLSVHFHGGALLPRSEPDFTRYLPPERLTGVAPTPRTCPRSMNKTLPKILLAE